MPRTRWLVITAAATLCLFPAVAGAAPVSWMDPSFGTGGVALLTPAGTTAQADAVTTVPACPAAGSCSYASIAGDVVAAGQETVGPGQTEFATAVVDPATGKPNPAFGTDGVATLLPTGSGATAQATGLAVYPSCPASGSCPWSAEAGDIVVTGLLTAAGSAQQDYYVVDYTPSGAQQWATTIAPSGFSANSGASVALDTRGSSPTGDVIVAGAEQPTPGGSVTPMLAALTPSGSIDSSFGGASSGMEYGTYIQPSGTNPVSQTFSAVTVDPAGDIVAAGDAVDASGAQSMLVARYTPDGSLDPRFGLPAGCTSSATCAGATEIGTTDTGLALALRPEPNSANCSASCYDVLVAGVSATNGGQPVATVAAVDQTGGVASDFSGGVVQIASSGGSEGTGIAVGPGGVAVSSQSDLESPHHAATATVSLLTPTGRVDSLFGSGGTFTIPSNANLTAAATAISAMPGSHDFVIAGALADASDSVERFGLARVTTVVPTQTELLSSEDPALRGDAVKLVAVVPGGAHGQVTFMDGRRRLGTATLSSAGTATFQTASLSRGRHEVTAVYGGDSGHRPSTSKPLEQTIRPPAALTTKACGTVTVLHLKVSPHGVAAEVSRSRGRQKQCVLGSELSAEGKIIGRSTMRLRAGQSKSISASPGRREPAPVTLRITEGGKLLLRTEVAFL